MSTQENVQVVKGFFAAMGSGDICGHRIGVGFAGIGGICIATGMNALSKIIRKQ